MAVVQLRNWWQEARSLGSDAFNNMMNKCFLGRGRRRIGVFHVYGYKVYLFYRYTSCGIVANSLGRRPMSRVAVFEAL